MKKKSLESIIASIKVVLSSYDIKGMINDALLYNDAKYIIRQLGFGYTETKEMMFNVYDYKLELPINFSKIVSARVCKKTNNNNHTYRFYQPQSQYTVSDVFQRICYDDCNIGHESDKFEITRTFEIESQRHQECFEDDGLLQIHPNVPKEFINSFCQNMYCKSPKYFDIKNNTMYFNFELGYVYLIYKSNLLDDDGYPQFIDNEFTEKSIYDYLMYKSLYYIYMGGDDSVGQRMQLADRQYRDSLKEAQYQDKIPDREEFLLWGKKRSMNYRLLETETNGSGTNIVRTKRRW